VRAGCRKQRIASASRRIDQSGVVRRGAQDPARRVWMIAIAGPDAAWFRKRGYDQAIHIQLKIGILDNCGVSESRLEVLYGALGGEAAIRSLLTNVDRIAYEF
jgi:NAD(P)H dehydrogenase (quinone)